jgi:hypothetical protein
MLWVLVAISATAGCFFDSRWTQAAPTQRQAAQRFTPAKMEATSSRPRPGAVRTLRVRVHAAPSHAAEVIDWQHRFEEIVEDANLVLGPELGIALEVEQMRPWNPSALGDDLAAVLAALASEDPGGDVSWIIGLTGSTPKLTFTVHELGYAVLFGKHIVLRATNDGAELEALARSFPNLDEAERDRLYRKRKRHKAVAVFLHEMGHALGALHEPSPSSLMNPKYDTKMSGFSAPTRALARLTLDHRLLPDDERDEPALIRAVIAELEKPSASTWVASEREAMLVQLRAVLGASTAPVAAAAPAAQPPLRPKTRNEATPSSLSPEAQKVYAQALDEERAGRKAAAWNLASPLFTAYPKVYAVQDLRCRLAMDLALDFDEMKEECAPLRELSGGLPEGWRKP